MRHSYLEADSLKRQRCDRQNYREKKRDPYDWNFEPNVVPNEQTRFFKTVCMGLKTSWNLPYHAGIFATANRRWPSKAIA